MSFIETLKKLIGGQQESVSWTAPQERQDEDAQKVQQLLEEKKKQVESMSTPQATQAPQNEGMLGRLKELISSGSQEVLSPFVSPKTQPETPSQASTMPAGKYIFQTQDKQPLPPQYETIVDNAASTYGVNPAVLVAMLSNESGHTWDPNIQGDSGNAVGLSQITVNGFWNGPHADGRKFNSPQEYAQALRDPQFAINEGARILKHKIEDIAGGDEFVGLMRYNGGGPQALKYAKDGFARVGLPVPKEYQ